MAEGVSQTSFAAGELSPNLYAREDIEKYSSGAAFMRNFYVDYRGGASNRPGTEFKAICTTDSDTRLIPFIFSQDQSYVLEFSNTNIRIYKEGAFVQDVDTVYPTSALFYLKYVQSADVMTLVHPDYPPYNLNRTSLTTFTFTLAENGPGIDPPGNLVATASTGGTLRYGYMVTALTENGEESLGSFPAFDDSVALDPTNAVPKTIKQEWDSVAGARAYNVYKWGPVPNDQPMPTLFGYIGQTKTTSFTDTNIAADYSRIPPEYRDPFSPGQITDITIAAGGTGFSGYEPLTITGDGTGATAFGVSDDTGALSGIVITNNGKNYTTATVSAAGGTGESLTAVIDTGNHYPSVVTYFQQRRVYGGADSTPELLEFSQVGAYENFDISPAVLDSDAITVNIASRQVNDIKALVPMSTGLVVFTTGCAFLVAGGQDNTVVTPSSVSAVPQASTGSNDIPPITVNYNILFVQQKGAIVRDMAFSFQTQSYYGVDRSMLANHLFFGYSIVDWAWAEEPYKLLWVVRNDGRALVMTYVPDQEVYGWSQHDTNGLFKSVCTVPEGDQDATYFVVSRYIQGPLNQNEQLWTNYFERLSFRTCDCPADAAFLDSFVSVPRAAGGSTLIVTRTDDEGGVTLTTNDPGQTAIPSAYLMQARQNFSPTELALLARTDAAIAFQEFDASQTFTGDSFDPVTRKFLYSFVQVYNNEQTSIYTLWDGTSSIAAGDPINTESFWNYWVLRRSIDDGTVESLRAWGDTRLVPAGIDGSDGTWRRMTDMESGFELQLRRLVDPRTQNIWQHTFGADNPCGLYLFRAEDDYQQIISPVMFVEHMEIGALSDDWMHVFQLGAGDGFSNLFLIPREITAEETTQDYLLDYADFALPSPLDDYYIRWTMDFNKNLWVFGCTMSGTREYRLYKFTPPTSAPYGGPVVGGGWTNVGLWDATHGPNTATAGYTINGSLTNTGRYNKNICFNISLTNPGTTLDAIALISKLMPADHTANSHDPTLMRWDCTYQKLDHSAFDYHQGFVKGYMTAAWVTTTDPLAAAYVVIDCQETNNYLNHNDFNFVAANGTETIFNQYNIRDFFFTVQKVVNGEWTYDTDNNHTVIVRYRFTYGLAPVCLAIWDEDLWFANYAYTGLANPMNKCMNALDQLSDIFYEYGLYDYQTKSWWWGGDQSHGNMALLDPLYLNRGDDADPEVSWPLLRISSLLGLDGASAEGGPAIDIACGTILVTAVEANFVTGVMTELIGQDIPNDPFNTISPIPAGSWFVADPVNQLAVPHLVGMEVGLLVDGMVHHQQIVPDTGLITWPIEQATTRAVCGLPYQSQLKTMYLTTGEPTTQGKMKVVSEVVVRVICTLGIKVGTDFTDLYECKDTMVIPYGIPQPHFEGDIQMNVANNWNLYGQITIQQDYPLPATILGVIPQVVIGDDD